MHDTWGTYKVLFMFIHISQIIQICSQYVFPIFCLSCNEEGVLACSRCLAQINRSPIQEELIEGVWLYSFLEYQERELAAKLIEMGKYHYMEQAFEYFFDVIKVQCQNIFLSDIDVICPVPLHKKRYAMRGFNQATIIAKMLEEITQKPVQDLLVRIRHTKQQATLSREERIENTLGAFGVKKEVRNLSVLLVDDVYTTGSTMRACVEALQQNGVSKVVCITLMYRK